MSKQRQIVGTFLILLIVFLAACAPAAAPAPQAPAPAPAAAPTPVAAPTPAKQAAPAVPARTAWEIEWEKTLEAAKKEGIVVFGCAAGSQARRDLSVAFKDKYGLQVESTAASTGVIISKILAERRAGLYLWDVLMAGSGSLVSTFKPAGASVPLEPALILPDLTNPEVIKTAWYDGKLPWLDKDHHIIGALLQVGQDLAINTNMVKPREIETWDDLLNPKWKGKILLLDPTMPGTGTQQSLMPMLYEVKGEDWMRKLAAQEPVIMGDDRLALDWLVHGKYPIYTSPRGDDFARYVEAGAPLASIETKDIMKAGARASNVTLVDRAPHPNAAKLFVNWILSKEGITITSKAYGGQSARNDVPTDFLPPYAIRKPGLKYWADSEEVYLKLPEYDKKSKNIFGPLKK